MVFTTADGREGNRKRNRKLREVRENAGGSFKETRSEKEGEEGRTDGIDEGKGRVGESEGRIATARDCATGRDRRSNGYANGPSVTR